MNKNHLAIIIIILCFISLIAGIIQQNKKPATQQLSEGIFSNNFEVIGDRIALLTIDGVITGNTNTKYFSEDFNTENFISAIDRIKKDDRAKAVIIRINSPGGTVAASQDIYDEVMRLRTIKPVVVSMGDVAASGGYYIASAADRIVAQRGTMTGSIGVILNFAEVSDLAKKLGITAEPIKSGKFKDSGSMYRKMSSDEHLLFQNSVNTAYNQFVNAIKVGRVERDDDYNVPMQELSMENLKIYADGRVFLGEEAFNIGFVDAIGSKYEAQVIASKMAGYENPLPIVSYSKPNGMMGLLMSMENLFSAPSITNIMPLSMTKPKQPLMIME